MEKQTFISREKDNIKVAKEILKIAGKLNFKLILLQGDLGAGKTSLTREIAKLLNSKEKVNSPTFVIQKNYKTGKNFYNFRKIAHFDLYRLESIKEIQDIGFFETLKEVQTLVIVEWPELLFGNVKNYLSVAITELENNKRKFFIKLDL